VARGSDIDAGSIEVDAAELRGELGGADSAVSSGTRSWHAVLLTSEMLEDMPGAEGLRFAFFQTGSRLRVRRSPMISPHSSETTL
jgi:hypothetical protein